MKKELERAITSIISTGNLHNNQTLTYQKYRKSISYMQV